MKILLIQTAFIGDVVLATALIEKLKQHSTNFNIDFLVRKGNETLLENNPHIHQVLIFDKKQKKYRNLFRLIKQIRANSYDYVINVQRFFTTGFITGLSDAKKTIGFGKNPLSFLFTHQIKHQFTNGSKTIHEIDRNLSLLEEILDDTSFIKPRLYPSEEDYKIVPATIDYICMAPASVWFTKQWPADKWCELINRLIPKYAVYLIGAPADIDICESIRQKTNPDNVKVLAGKLSYLQSAALIKKAKMTFVNDSAPLHFASAVNAPVTAIFCSTVPAFGFGPVSDHSFIAETEHKLDCRPCGLHGKKKCPEGHFRCSEINIDKLLAKTKIL